MGGKTSFRIKVDPGSYLLFINKTEYVVWSAGPFKSVSVFNERGITGGHAFLLSYPKAWLVYIIVVFYIHSTWVY